MKKLIMLSLVFSAVCLLGACSSVTKEKLGLSKKAPDEFLVIPRRPLSLPPEYELRPVVEPKQEAVPNADLSEGERNLLAEMKGKN